MPYFIIVILIFFIGFSLHSKHLFTFLVFFFAVLDLMLSFFLLQILKKLLTNLFFSSTNRTLACEPNKDWYSDGIITSLRLFLHYSKETSKWCQLFSVRFSFSYSLESLHFPNQHILQQQCQMLDIISSF